MAQTTAVAVRTYIHACAHAQYFATLKFQCRKYFVIFNFIVDRDYEIFQQRNFPDLRYLKIGYRDASRLLLSQLLLLVYFWSYHPYIAAF